MNCRRRARCLPMACAVAVFVCGCGKQQAGNPGSGGGMVIPVLASEVRVMPVNETLSLVGSVMANEFVEIKAETEGVVQEVNFTEGQPVKKGDLLIRLDETKFSTALAEAEASFKLSQATF